VELEIPGHDSNGSMLRASLWPTAPLRPVLYNTVQQKHVRVEKMKRPCKKLYTVMCVHDVSLY
jgi:hypothetical protein